MTTHTLHTLILCLVIFGFAQAVLCGWYASAEGFSGLACFIAALCIGFPLVVLAIAIGSGIKRGQEEPAKSPRLQRDAWSPPALAARDSQLRQR